MFRRTRIRIVAAVMAGMLLVIAVLMAAIYLSSYSDIQRQNYEMLERFASQYASSEGLAGAPGPGSEAPAPGGFAPAAPQGSPEGPGAFPGDGGMPPADGRFFELSTFYSVEFDADGKLIAADTGDRGIYTAGELEAVARAILAKNRTSGEYEGLLYVCKAGSDHTLVAMMDNTVINEGVRTLMRNTVIAGAAAVAVVFALAVFVAGHIVKPLEENDAKQKQFISDAGHELKTPVSVISANAELLERQQGCSEWLSNIRYENEKMGSLVSRLLELSRAESRTAVFETIDLGKLVTGEVLPFESVAFEKGRELKLSAPEGIEVSGDRTQLGQLVSVLVDNAIEHSSGEGAVEVSLARQHRSAVLSVSNSGPEIPEAERGLMFERFYRRDEARGEGGGHFGLGLAIAKAIAQAHGGGIGVECKDSRVCFTVSLPLK